MLDNFRYDIDGFISELEIELEEAEELYKSYETEMNEEIEEMEQLCSAKEYEKLERVVHNVKGVSANLRINDVYEVAADFDIKLKNGVTSSADANVAYLVLRIKDSIVEIKEFFKVKGL